MNIRVLDYVIHTVYPKWSLNEQLLINTINPHSYCVAMKDASFKKALLDSDILIPDGIGIVLACKFLNGKRITRITGADMHQHLLQEAERNKLKIFYLGASDNTLKKIHKRVTKEYPNVRIASFSPKFKPEFTEDDTLEMITAVNQFSPDILFIGMTAPKQEKWSYANKERLNVSIITSIGAVFDFYAGSINRAPKWMMKIGMEWLYRFFKEPKRMWKRYLINNTRFIYYVLKAKFF
ncbi:MAG: WecB/TagA/CpsF family glycosyltransferase [Flavobacteriaceae bacterium]|nr:WecB/TagA/CpsF family glycosyltransferase [Flavobacteriaceae bacterium]